MHRAFWVGGFLVVVLVVTGAWAWVSLYLPYQGFAAPGVYVDIPRGASRRAIAHLLADQGVVRSRWVFEALSRRRSRRTLQAGEYFFDHPATAFEVFDALANGRVYVRELLIPEGYSMFDIADLVAREGFTSRDDFLAAARDPAPVRDLAPNAPSLEGYLFPATYEFPRHPSGRNMVDAMVKRFRQEWAAISAQAGDPPEHTLEQTVTLASLVERETPRPEERPLVAGVFVNRLRRGVPLQCDPTVVYALESAGQYKGTLDAKDLPFDSPYNTYRHLGLPPGPIANPGEASLRAALAPAKTDYLYFVANAEGGHFFSKTLAEHNRNVARYRRRLAVERNASRSWNLPQAKE
jgi:peptidoglycan lytic transglycosylase G